MPEGARLERGPEGELGWGSGEQWEAHGQEGQALGHRAGLLSKGRAWD